MSERHPTPPEVKLTDPAVVGLRWGDPISEARQAELKGYLDRWAAPAEHGGRMGPFDSAGIRLTGADASWLAEHSGYGEYHDVPDLHLEGADLTRADLRGANFNAAHLEGALLFEAQLERADLRFAHLEAAILTRAHLDGANLRRAWFDSKTVLYSTKINDRTHLVDIQWSGIGAVNLTSVTWDRVPRLGDERDDGWHDSASTPEAVVRAYRQVASQVRAQGLTDVADRFSLRAQEYERRVLLRRGRVGKWLFSWLLAILAGYGYRPALTLMWYIIAIGSFTWGYMQVTHGVSLFGLTEPKGTKPLQWYEALVLSVASFHGRGFFPQGINLGDPVAILAAAEALVGLIIEVSVIATFTQRFFGAK